MRGGTNCLVCRMGSQRLVPIRLTAEQHHVQATPVAAAQVGAASSIELPCARWMDSSADAASRGRYAMERAKQTSQRSREAERTLGDDYESESEKWDTGRKARVSVYTAASAAVGPFSPSSPPTRGRRAIALLGSSVLNVSIGRTAIRLKVRCIPCGIVFGEVGETRWGLPGEEETFRERLRTREGAGEEYSNIRSCHPLSAANEQSAWEGRQV